MATDLHIIDEEHAVLMAAMADLLFDDKRNKEELCVKFRKILDDLRTHFDDEEEIMNDIEYFRISNHKEVHRTFLETAEKLYSQAITSDCRSDIIDLISILDKYSSAHFEIADMAVKFHLMTLPQ